MSYIMRLISYGLAALLIDYVRIYSVIISNNRGGDHDAPPNLTDKNLSSDNIIDKSDIIIPR